MTKVCDKCGNIVPIILYIRVTISKTEKWCLNCAKNRFGQVKKS